MTSVWLHNSKSSLNSPGTSTSRRSGSSCLKLICIQSLGPTDNADRADEFSNATGPAVSRAFDLWLLGKHRVYCGSAPDPLAYELLMAEERLSAVFTDPPYNVKIDCNVCSSGAVKHREFAMASGEMTQGERARFLAGAFDLARTCAAPARSSMRAWTGDTWPKCSPPVIQRNSNS